MDIGKLIQNKKSLVFIVCGFIVGIMLILGDTGSSNVKVNTEKTTDNITVELEKTLSQV